MRRSARIPSVALPVLLGLIVRAALAQDAGAPPAAAPADTELDEVTITAKKLWGTQLWQLRQQMVQVEDRFYARYNALNTRDDFDIHCTVAAPVGSNRERRHCEAQYLLEAQGTESHAFLDGMLFDGGGTVGSRPTQDAMPRQAVAMGRAAEYRKTMLAVINDSPELRRLLGERSALQRKYEQMFRQRFGRDAPPP